MASVAGSKPASYATPNGPPPASFDYPNRNMRRMSTKQQNIPVEGISTSPASASEDFGAMAAALSDSTMFPDSASNSSSDGPLLAYDLASPTSRDFPMPPNSRPPSPRQFFPHPNAPPPPSPTTGSMLPAIHRPLANVANMEPSTSSHRHLSMTLARTTNANQDRTFHGQMTSDLLSAKGPVPIQFALGAFSTPPAPSQSQRYPNSNGPNVIANPNPGSNTRMVEPPAPALIRNLNPSTPSTAKGSPRDEGSTMAPRSQTLDAPSTTKDNNRRSYTDIIAAIDTPSSFPIGRGPREAAFNRHNANLVADNESSPHHYHQSEYRSIRSSTLPTHTRGVPNTVLDQTDYSPVVAPPPAVSVPASGGKQRAASLLPSADIVPSASGSHPTRRRPSSITTSNLVSTASDRQLESPHPSNPASTSALASTPPAINTHSTSRFPPPKRLSRSLAPPPPSLPSIAAPSSHPDPSFDSNPASGPHYRSRPPLPLRINNQHQNPRSDAEYEFAMPKFHAAGGISSMPASPHLEDGPSSRAPIHGGRGVMGAKSNPNLRDIPGPGETLPRPTTRERQGSSGSGPASSRLRKKSSTMLSESSESEGGEEDEDEEEEDDILSYNADILGHYGLELSPNWDPEIGVIPSGSTGSPSLSSPRSYFGAMPTSSPLTATFGSGIGAGRERERKMTGMSSVTTSSSVSDGGSVTSPPSRFVPERKMTTMSASSIRSASAIVVGAGANNGSSAHRPNPLPIQHQAIQSIANSGPVPSSPTSSQSPNASPSASTPTTSTSATTGATSSSASSPTRSASLRHKLSLSAINKRRRQDSLPPPASSSSLSSIIAPPTRAYLPGGGSTPPYSSQTFPNRAPSRTHNRMPSEPRSPTTVTLFSRERDMERRIDMDEEDEEEEDFVETVEVDDMEFTLVKPEVQIRRNGSPLPPEHDPNERRNMHGNANGDDDMSGPIAKAGMPAAEQHERGRGLRTLSSGPASTSQSLPARPFVNTHPKLNSPQQQREVDRDGAQILSVRPQIQIQGDVTGPHTPSPTSPPQTPLFSPFSTASTFAGVGSSSGPSASRTSFNTVTTNMSDFAAPRPAPVPGYSPNGSLAFPGGAALTEEAAKAKADMYRQLELKWIAVMNAVPSAEAGKSRKVRKLVIDGIPASVRGVVWLYLTDNKGRRMPGVYGQLSRRKVAATKEIWADVQTRFPDQPHLCEAEGPIMSILQAYLSMVPDTIYSYGLALIAGNLLLQTHDEDAFWTFVAIMDRHLRGYFSPTARLLEIDSILFERAVISSDKALAARLFDDFRVPAAEFCSHWFTTIFACALPPSYLPRIWDTIMFFSDPTFILRLGLAMLKLCGPFIMDAARCHSGEDARNYLIRPPLSVFPKDPDSILSIAFSLKMKEDELKKLRPKVEAQLKQRHPLRAPSGSMRS